MLKLLPFDLHVLGLPLAFILSQDQTLHCKLLYTLFELAPQRAQFFSLFLRLLFFFALHHFKELINQAFLVNCQKPARYA